MKKSIRIPEINQDSRLFKVFVHLILYLLVVISLMPVIAWWAGIAGLIYFLFEIYRFIFPGKLSPGSFITSVRVFAGKSTGKITLYIILFGIIIHGACRIHSEILLHNLYNEAKTEKNIILGNIENE